MAGSYKILSVMGIDIKLHWTFMIFIGALLLLNPSFGLLLLLVFFFVTLHELSHSFVAVRNGIRVKEILLIPIGGLAMISKTHIKPWIEVKMSLAGPLLNLMIVGLCWAIASIYSLPLGAWLGGFIAGEVSLTLPEMVLFYSFYANLVLGAFNLLIPAFPLDGGRVFRALLAMKLDYVRATYIARTVSISIAAFLFFLAILAGDLWIMIIAMFIALGAISEYESILLDRTLSRISIKDVMSEEYLVAGPGETLSGVVDAMLAERSFSAVVLDGKRVMVLDLNAVAGVPRGKWGKIKAGDVSKDVGHVGPHTGIGRIIKQMSEKGTSMLPVVYKDRLVGVVNKTDIERMVRITSALRK